MWITLHVSVLANRKRFLNFSVLHNASQEIAGLHFLDRMSGYDLQPCISARYCSGVISRASSFVRGQLKPPSSSLL